MIRVVVVDDEEMIRSAIVALLALEEDVDVVGEAGNGADGLDLVRTHEPDVVLLDLEMPPTDGIEVATQIDGLARSVLMTRHARPGVLRRAMAAGIAGFVPKSSPLSALAQVIREGKSVTYDLKADRNDPTRWEEPFRLAPDEAGAMRAVETGHRVRFGAAPRAEAA